MSENSEETRTSHKRTKKRIANRLNAVGWGLFFIWMGVSLLMDLSWGAGLVGVSAIVLLGQAARRSFGLRLEPFWVVAGGLFLLGGVWDLNNIDVDLLPIVLILAGGVLMLSLFRRGSRIEWRDWCRGTSYRGAERWRCCSWPTDDRKVTGR
jgi:hypothetical protein